MSTGQSPEEKRKGLSPWAWVAIGCGGLLVVATIVAMVVGMYLFGKAKQVAQELEEDPVLATSKLIAAANPEIELVSADKERRIVTFRNVKTGEVLTFSYKDIEEGKVTFSSDEKSGSIEVDTKGGQGGLTVTSGEGRMTLGTSAEGYPGWLPTYPGVTPEGKFSTDTPEMRTGTFTFATEGRADDVLDFYARELEARGFKIQAKTTTPAGAFLTAEAEGGQRTASIAVSSAEGKLQVVVNFSEKKP